MDNVYWVVQKREFLTWKAHLLFSTKAAAEQYATENAGSFKVDRVVLVCGTAQARP